MPNKNYRKGYRLEKELMKKFFDAGYFAIRTAGSHSPFDILVWDNHRLLAIQIKANKKPSSKEIEKIAKTPQPYRMRKLIAIRRDREKQWIFWEIINSHEIKKTKLCSELEFELR